MNKNLLKNSLWVGVGATVGAAAMALIMSGKEPSKKPELSNTKDRISFAHKEAEERKWSETRCKEMVVATARKITAETLSDDEILQKAYEIQLKKEVEEELEKLNFTSAEDRKKAGDFLLNGFRVKWLSKAGKLVFISGEIEIPLDLEGAVSKKEIEFERDKEEFENEFQEQMTEAVRQLMTFDVKGALQELDEMNMMGMRRLVEGIGKAQKKINEKEDPLLPICESAYLTFLEALKSDSSTLKGGTETTFFDELSDLEKNNPELHQKMEPMIGNWDLVSGNPAWMIRCAEAVSKKYQTCTE